MTSIDKRLAAIDPVTAWAERVDAGKIVAGPHIRDTARRHLRDLEDGRDRGLVWDLDGARHAIDWFSRHLKHTGGDFQALPFIPHESQAFRLGSLFGWKTDAGDRRFRVFYDEEGKGNGKSPLLAGIGLYVLTSVGRARAEVYAAAAKKDQAMIVFSDAVAMRDLSDELTARVSVKGSNPVTELIYHGRRPGDRRIFKPISSDDKQSGVRPQVSLADEVHEHRNRRIVSMQERGLNKQPRNSLLAMATNSGHDRTTLCWERHTYAIRVAAGDVTGPSADRFFSFVCSLDHGDDWQNDEATWAKPNPLLDVTMTREALRDATSQAKAIPGTANDIARLHFCVWTEAHTVWIPRDQLEACEDPDFDLADFEGQDCNAALDLSVRRDMTGKALIFNDGQTADGRPCFAIWFHGYLPKGTLLDREREDDAPYSQWVGEEHLTAAGDNKVDYGKVARDLREDCNRFNVLKLCMDMHLGDFFLDALGELGMDDLEIVAHAQGWSKTKHSPLFMPHSIAIFEQLIAEKRLRIGINPAFRAAIMSVAFKLSPAGLRRFDKAAATARIDLAVVGAMAAGIATTNTETEEESFWMAEAS